MPRPYEKELIGNLTQKKFYFKRFGLGYSAHFWPNKQREIVVEFCMGDQCVGLFDSDAELLGEKVRCTNIKEVEAAIKALTLLSNN